MNQVRIFFKIILASIISTAILSVISCLYALTPIHIDNPQQNTDYVWTPNSYWIKFSEGISWGKMDSQGYNNLKVVENPDILLLGSSHAQAVNVLQNQSTSYLLGQLFDEKYTVYNMGISGHDFYKVCQYLPTTLENSSKVPQYIIIETSSVELTTKQVDKVLDKTISKTPSHTTGLVGTLQKIPFLRTVYQNLTEGLIDRLKNDGLVSGTTQVKTQQETAVEQIAYGEMFAYLADIENEYGTQIIVFYHPTGVLQKDGGILFSTSQELTAFTSSAEKYGITFVDLTEAFEELYYSKHKVAHGFITGKLQYGHLNKYGHQVAAQELYETITHLEKERD